MTTTGELAADLIVTAIRTMEDPECSTSLRTACRVLSPSMACTLIELVQLAGWRPPATEADSVLPPAAWAVVEAAALVAQSPTRLHLEQLAGLVRANYPHLLDS